MIKKICLILVGCLFCSSVALAYKQADLDKLLATKDCGGCDLSSAPLANKDLNKANLQGADLQGADLHNASLRMAELAGADLRKADLSMTIFEAADLSKVDLRGAKTVGAVFDGAYLADTKIDDKSKISDKTLKQEAAVSAHKDAVGAVVQPQSNAEKKLPVLSRKELLEKALDDEKCIECDFSGMDLRKTKFKNGFFERCNFEGANLSDANLKNADLKGANFRNANLTDAYLKGADLYNANLSGADLTDADLKDASLDGAYLGGATLKGTLLEKKAN